MEEKLIKALSSLTGIRESKLKELEANVLYDIIDKPNIIEPTDNQLQKLYLLNELVINFRITKDFKHRKQINFNSSYEAGKYFKHLIGNKKDKEIFLLAMFDKNNNLIKIKKISEGTINSAPIYPRDIVKEVLSAKCKSVIFCHNHPSGIATPSDEDISMTNKYVNILEPLKIKVKDHIIVGNNIFSFLENNLLKYNEIRKGRVAEKDINDYVSKTYYEAHLNKYLNALSGLTGIRKEKLNTFIGGEKGKIDNPFWHHKALEILENPSLIASKLGLSNSEKRNLENLNGIFSSLKSYIKKDIAPVHEPGHINTYIRTYLDEKELDANNLYIMLFNNKNRVMGFEKLSCYEGNDLIFNPKDILQKSINYEASSISIIMTSKKAEVNYKNKNIDELIEISKNAVNMLLPIQIKVIDSIYINEDKYISMVEKGLHPYTNVGQPEYKRTKIFEYGIEKAIIEENELYKDEFEDEEEWEFDF